MTLVQIFAGSAPSSAYPSPAMLLCCFVCEGLLLALTFARSTRWHLRLFDALSRTKTS